MTKLYTIVLSFFCVLIINSQSAAAETAGWTDTLLMHMKKTVCSDKYEFYLPLHTWHNRLTYDRRKIKEYNENPWGGGLGKYYIDSAGNQHSLYVMAFKDSHNDFEPVTGYAWQKNWYLDEAQDWRFGLGYTLLITVRSDYDYIPIPGALPLMALEYKQVAVQGTYVPGFTKNSGNVALVWAKLKF
ncbi:MAG: lipid IV(A) palmitoyltransferase PagP [Alphaproteobacteria bacterium]